MILSAYEFWLKPFGLLKIGGYLRNRAEVRLFDFMDRNHPSLQGLNLKKDEWGRGKFPVSPTRKPETLAGTPGKFSEIRARGRTAGIRVDREWTLRFRAGADRDDLLVSGNS